MLVFPEDLNKKCQGFGEMTAFYIFNYYMTNSYRPGIKKFDWFKAGL